MMLTAQDSLQGVINGRVINKTLGNKGMEGLEIILHPYVGEKELKVHRTKTDRTGFFLFQGVRTDQNTLYHLSTKYKDVEYYNQAMQFKDKKKLSSDFSVYETTDQDSDILIKMYHFFLDVENDSFQISEALVVENRGNRVYVGPRGPSSGKNETLRVSLAKEAGNLRFEPRAAPFMVKTANGFIDTSDIKPGTKRILFSYAVKADDLNFKLIKNMPYQTENLSVVFPDKGLTVKSNQLAFKKQVKDSGRQYFLMAGKDFAKGSQVILQVNSVKNKNIFQWVVVGMLVLFVGVGAAIPLINRKNFQQSAHGRISSKDPMNAPGQRQAVIQAIAKLDDLAESGDIDPEIYQKDRDELLIKAKACSRLLGSNT